MTENPDITETEELLPPEDYTSTESETEIEGPKLNEEGFTGSIIEKLGIVGWQDVEDIILAALLTGDSIMLYGPKGEAKTEVAKRIAYALDVDFREIDASKANFDDLGGFPNIIGQAQNPDAPPFISTPLNIWNVPFLFIDEFARATLHIQNKLMEIIRSRRFMGYPTGAKWVFSAMNPLSDEYVGNNPVDIAAASRFSWVILCPVSSEMSISDLKTVAITRSFDDTSALEHWTGTKSITHKHLPDTFDDAKADLKRLLTYASKIYEGLSLITRNAIPHYVAEVIKLLKAGENYNVDGRRASTLTRAIMALYSIKLARTGQIETDQSRILLEEVAYTALCNALSTIDLVIGTDPDKILTPMQLSKVHNSSKATLLTGEVATTYQLITTKDPVESFNLIINNESDQITILLAMTRLLMVYPVLASIIASMPSCANIPQAAKDTVIKTAAIINSVGHRLLKYPNHALYPLIGNGDCGMSSHRGAYNNLQNTLNMVEPDNKISMVCMKTAFMAALETAARSLSVHKKDKSGKLYNSDIYYNWNLDNQVNTLESLHNLKDYNLLNNWTYMVAAWGTSLPDTDRSNNIHLIKGNDVNLDSLGINYTLSFPIRQNGVFNNNHLPDSNNERAISSIGYDLIAAYMTQYQNIQMNDIPEFRGAAIPGVTDASFIFDIIVHDGIITENNDSQMSNTIYFIAAVTQSLYTRYISIAEQVSIKALEYINGTNAK